MTDNEKREAAFAHAEATKEKLLTWAKSEGLNVGEINGLFVLSEDFGVLSRALRRINLMNYLFNELVEIERNRMTQLKEPEKFEPIKIETLFEQICNKLEEKLSKEDKKITLPNSGMMQ